MLKLYNSLTRTIEEFKPIKDKTVGFYICGPTVYNNAHIGNLRTMILSDILRRVLEYDSYQVTEIMNVTDVGHLTSDGDSGEDKMEKNASTKDEVFELAEKYTKNFLENLKDLNIKPASELPKASDHIKEQIEMIKTLIEKDFAYESDEAVYFDISKFPEYTKLTGQNLSDMMLGARQEVVKDQKKKNPNDFVLWFKTVGRYKNHILRWDSPWGEGFPGWHIECSAMSKKYLGDHFDIHAGGIDLKFPHHTNEIAQSESANGVKMANYWVHGEHLLISEGKMAKSEGNFLTLSSLVEKKFNPLAYRYLTLTAHYRSKLNFTFESLAAAQNALNNLYQEISGFEKPKGEAKEFEQAFADAINDDLDMPKALSIVWDLIRTDEVESSAKLATLFKFDQILGLNLENIWKESQKIPTEVKTLIAERENARKEKDFQKSDDLRKQIGNLGYLAEDTPDGVKLKKKF